MNGTTFPIPPGQNVWGDGKAIVLELLLIAATTEGAEPYNIQRLCVECWHKHRKAFGLKNYEEIYPDFKRFYHLFCGKVGLTTLGLVSVETVRGQRIVRLTAKGFGRAKLERGSKHEVRRTANPL